MAVKKSRIICLDVGSELNIPGGRYLMINKIRPCYQRKMTTRWKDRNRMTAVGEPSQDSECLIIIRCILFSGGQTDSSLVIRNYAAIDL